MSSSTAPSLKVQPASGMQPQGAVQSFSRKWSTDNLDSPLAQGLVAFTDQQLQKENYMLLWDGKSSLSRDKQVVPLDKELREMTAQWKKFQDELPEDERATREGDPPTLSTIVTAIQYWTNKCSHKAQDEYGSTKANLQEFCITMDAHSQLFSIFPNGDKYVSLLSGTISSIVKAFVNHAKISEGFSNALVTIGLEIKFWKDTIELHSVLVTSPVNDHSENSSPQAGDSATAPKIKNQYIIKIVVELYTKVFSFLAAMMEKWMKSKFRRVINSFNQNFYDKYIQDPMNELRKLSRNLEREAQTLHQWDVKRLLSEVKEGRKNSQKNYQKLYALNNTNKDEVIQKMEMILDEKQNKWKERENGRLQGVFDKVTEMQALLEEMKEQQALVGAPAFDLLIESIVSKVTRRLKCPPENHANSATLLSPQPTRKTIRSRQASPTASTGIITTYTQGYLERASRSLEPYCPHNFPVSQLNSPRNQGTPNNIFQRLQAWLTGAESDVLWIYGPSQTPRPSVTSFAATHVVHTLEQANVPIIAYYCDADNAKANPLEELIRLVYSLIRQLVWHVPGDFSDKINFDQRRFDLLDGTPKSMEEGLSLFRDLMAVVPRLLFCVIDGINMLEVEEESDDDEADREDEDEDEVNTKIWITQLLAVLKKCKKTKVLKALVVTDGYSNILFNDRCFNSRVNAIATAKFRSGKKRARRQLSRLRYSDVGSSVAEDTEESDSSD